MSNTPPESYGQPVPPNNQYPYPGPVQPYGYNSQSPYGSQPKTNALAITGLSISGAGVLLAVFFPFIISIVGVVFSAISLSQIKHRGKYESGRGLALAGLWIGIGTVIIEIIIAVLFIIFIVIASANSSGGYDCGTGFYCPSNT